MAPKDEHALSGDLEEVGVKVGDLEELLLFGDRRIGLARPSNEPTGGDVEYRHELCSRAGVRRPHVDADGKNVELPPSGGEHLPSDHLLEACGRSVGQGRELLRR
jgi:hypothetical protein